MSLAQASQRALGHSACLRSSYAEISRFVRTRHHGITFNRAPLCSWIATRSFANLQAGTNSISPDEKLRKALSDYKESSMHLSQYVYLLLTHQSKHSVLEG
jgi:aspartyl-tRNA synthetase